MTDAPRLTLHDQLAINLCGWIGHAWSQDPNLPLMLAQLRRVLPLVSRALPMIDALAEAAEGLLRELDQGGLRNVQAATEARQMHLALSAIFMARAAQASAAIWPDENLTHAAEEPAHAAE